MYINAYLSLLDIWWFEILKVRLFWYAVQGLQVMYSSLNNPSQLANWQASGGDPCGQSWKGVTCQGSAVVAM